MKRLRLKQATSLEERLVKEARQSRERAMSLPPGQEREARLRKARRDETADHRLTTETP
jgi:hypothetical protein